MNEGKVSPPIIDRDDPKSPLNSAQNSLLLNEGDKDKSLGKAVSTLIYASENFIIYLDEDDIVQWEIGDDYGEYPKDFGLIVNRASYLETLAMNRFPQSHLASYTRLLAEGLARLIGEKDSESAKLMLDYAEKEIIARSTERARMWYLMASSFVSIIFLIGTYIVWALQSSSAFGQGSASLIIGTGLGSLGALISVISRSRELAIDASAGKLVHYFEGASRVIVGMAGAFFIALAIKANIVLGVTNSGDHADTFLFVMCIVAGASERLAPNLIQQIELSTTREKPDEAPTGDS